MKILITGAGGFVGKALVRGLTCSYRDIDLYLWTRGSGTVPAGARSITGNLNNRQSYRRLAGVKFDMVVHCAGYVPRGRQDDIRRKCLDGNFKATSALLRNVRTKKVIFLSTCEVYGPQPGKTGSITEDDIPHPVSNYARSKLLAEEECRRLARRRNFSLCILRLTTLYGKHDEISRAIPNFAIAARTGKKLKVSGQGRDIRDYLYIKDAASVIIAAIFSFKPGLFNVSAGRGVTIKKLAQTVISAFGTRSNIEYTGKGQQRSRLVFDNTGIKRYFGFRQKFPLPRGLAAMANKDNLFIDLDGTLVDVSNRWYRLHLDLAEVFGFKPVTKKDYIKLKRSGLPERTIISQTNIARDRIDTYLETRINLIETGKYLRYDRLKPGVMTLLKKLSVNYNIILMTNRKNRNGLYREITGLGLKPYLSAVQAAGTRTKASLVRSKYKPADYGCSWMIGDTEEDYAVAKRLKMRSVLLGDGVRDKSCFKRMRYAYIADSIKDITGII